MNFSAEPLLLGRSGAAPSPWPPTTPSGSMRSAPDGGQLELPGHSAAILTNRQDRTYDLFGS